MTRLALTLHDTDGPRHAAVPVEALVIAGWTGRDEAGVQAHIRELAALGVKPPPRVPMFYRVSAARLTTAPRIEVAGPHSSGEAEFVLLHHEDRLWVGVGSDHTDRRAEAFDVTVSKQMCEKPVGAEFWMLAEVAAHWDRLVLRAWADGALYQEGAVAEMREPRALLDAYAREAPGGLANAGMMFGGTLPVRGGVRPATRFAMELADPVLGRALRWEYAVVALPDVV